MSESSLRNRNIRSRFASNAQEQLSPGLSHPDLSKINYEKQSNYNPSKFSKHRRTASYSGPRNGHNFKDSMSRAVANAEEFMSNIIKGGWEVVHHWHLPKWLRDNDFLLFGHRPQLPSFRECFVSIFRMHTETLNIWTHLLGFVFFLILSIWFLIQPGINLDIQELFVVSIFFLSAILALGFSWIFHTVYCHSECVKVFFNKLDYAGIAILTIGSFVPWLHFSFYCHQAYKIAYLVLVICLGIFCVIVSVQDKFQSPHYRSFRAGLFVALGASGVVPCLHFIHLAGFWDAITFPPLAWLVLMAIFYVTGALIYAMRFPERWRPGKFDIWFQSHQIFHVFVVLAAFAHYKGIMHFAQYRQDHKICMGDNAL